MQILIFIFNFVLLWQSTGRFDDWKVGAFSAILVLIVGVGTVSLILVFAFFAYQRQQKRSKSFQTFAAQNGWDFVPNATVDYFKNSSRHSLFGKDFRGRIIALIQKPSDGGQIFVFDYNRTSKKHKQTQKMTVIGFHSPRLQLPYFSLYPESYWSFPGELIGSNDIDFPSHPNFSKRYKLSG